MKQQPKPRPKHPCSQTCPDRTAECKRSCERWKQYEAAKQEDYKNRAEISKVIGAIIQTEQDRKKRGCSLASYKDSRR